MGAGVGGAVLLHKSMPLMSSSEESEGRFVSVVAGRPTPPSGMLLGGSGSGEGGVGVVGRGETGVVVTRLSATSVLRRVVGAPAVFSMVNFSCR
jgi:hypothetical protein